MKLTCTALAPSPQVLLVLSACRAGADDSAHPWQRTELCADGVVLRRPTWLLALRGRLPWMPLAFEARLGTCRAACKDHNGAPVLLAVRTPGRQSAAGR